MPIRGRSLRLSGEVPPYTSKVLVERTRNNSGCRLRATLPAGMLSMSAIVDCTCPMRLAKLRVDLTMLTYDAEVPCSELINFFAQPPSYRSLRVHPRAQRAMLSVPRIR